MDEDPRHIEIMERWVRRIITEVSADLADGIVERVGRIFLDAKNSNVEAYDELRKRIEKLSRIVHKP